MALVADPRPYQLAPLEDFYDQQYMLLAFDTGLGKTFCAVAAAEHLLETAQVNRVLLIVPASLKYQWAEAIAKFTDLPTQPKKFKGELLTIPDSRYCMVIDGPPASRRKQYKLAREEPRCNYVIIGYDNVRSDNRDVLRLRAEFVVLDEASEIKTMKSGITKAVKEHIVAPWRMALTATPIDNRPDELFSIMEWVAPDVLGRGDLYDRCYVKRNAFGDPVGYRNLHTLRERLGKAMYRKSVDDPDVAPFMPDRQIIDWPVAMGDMDRELYARVAWDLLEALEEAVKSSGGRSFSVSAHYAGDADDSTPPGKVMSRHLAMEMFLDHPGVLRASALRYATPTTGPLGGSKYAWQVFKDYLDPAMETSPKLRELLFRLRQILSADPDAKVIIFTRFRVMQQIIMDELASEGWDAVEYHGGLSTAEQTAARARFMTHLPVRFFVSTHAGERGTDLPVANWLVNYDPVWSSGQADQINGRHMRTSSEHADIFVANMYVEGTVEERKLDQQDEKRELARAVVDGLVPRSGRLDKDVASLKRHIEEWLTRHDPDGMFRG